MNKGGAEKSEPMQGGTIGKIILHQDEAMGMFDVKKKEIMVIKFMFQKGKSISRNRL